MAPAAFCVVLAAVALALFALPYPSWEQLKQIRLVQTTQARIAIVGQSTISYTSVCDRDRRTIPEMLAAESGSQVLDLGAPGQALSDTLNWAAISGNGAAIKDVVVPLDLLQTEDWTTPVYWYTPPYRKLLLYKLLAPAFQVFAVSNIRDFVEGLTARPNRSQRGYSFEGNNYPNYGRLSATEFAREKQLARCPEVVTHNPGFTRSYFWWTHVAVTPNKELYGLVASLKSALAAKGKRLHLVVMPINYGLMVQFDSSWPDIVRRKEQTMTAGLAKTGLSVIDLSDEFAPGEFSSQWCACTHLNEKGRLHFVRAVIADLANATAQQRRPTRFAARSSMALR